MSAEEVIPMSDFNQAQAYQIRLHEIQALLNEHSRNEDYSRWYKELLVFYKELSSRIDTDDAEYAYKELKAMLPLSNMNQADALHRFDPNIFFRFHDIDIRLRAAMNKKGLLMKNADDPGEAI